MIASEWLVRRQRLALVPTELHVSLDGGGWTRLVVVDPPEPPRGVLVIVHGLGGAAGSPNTLRLAAAAAARGWRAVAVDMRGAGGSRAQPRMYTAADLDELDAALRHPVVAEAAGPKIAVGLSLGGGILLRWLGIRSDRAPVDAALAFSPTGHLPSCAEALSRLRHRFYDWSFARSLGRRVREVAPASGRRPHAFLRHWTMRRLDDDFAAFTCGLPSARRYWDHASAHHHVGGIARPVLIIAAADDPFVPIGPLTEHFGALPGVELGVFRHGAHLSFLERVDGRLVSRFPEMLLTPLEKLAPKA
jgi:predicted alpha/beta-fold hydrolase